ncbi:MAG: CoA transferase [Chloroflexi bacterium]|nr:CoA transferase [Chloroflexota bacterium]
MTGPALAGLNVLDLSEGISGGYCTKVLSDLGAQVIKIEASVVGDCTRRMGPFLNDVPSIEASAPFLYLNAGKKSITLNIEADGAKSILKELVKRTDILVESFKPGYLAELGLGYPDLEEANPGLIMASISYFGQDGPYRDYEGCELVAFAMSGYMYLTGDEDREPLKAGGYQAEYQGGLAAAMAILAALNYRDYTEEGQYIDVSTIEALAATLDGVSVFTTLEHDGVLPRRAGTRLIRREPRAPYPSTLLPCKDGWIHVHYSPSNPEGIALLTGNPRLADPEVLGAMNGHADEIDQIITDWLKGHTREEAQALAQEIRIPFTMVQSIPEVMEDPQHKARDFFVAIDHPVAGPLKYPRSPFAAPKDPGQPARAPLLGEHNQQIYCQLLGRSSQELSGLADLNVI